MTRQLRTATKEEIIEALEDLPEGALVAFASDYGDHCHTQQVHRLKANVDCAAIRESAYSDSGFAVDEDGDGAGVHGEAQEVYILS